MTPQSHPTVRITEERARTIFAQNCNLTKDLMGRINKALALRLTHDDLEAIRAGALSSRGNVINLKIKE